MFVLGWICTFFVFLWKFGFVEALKKTQTKK